MPGLLLLHTEAEPPGVRVFSGRGEVTLGRHPDRDICLEDASISRHHAAFLAEGDHIQVRDEGSHNGTFLNGQRLTGEVLLTDGDIVRAGTSLLMKVPDIIEYRGWPSQAEAGPLMGGPSMAAVRERIELLAPLNSHVLVKGESGTGKDLAARSLHQASGRQGRYVAINCAALSESLFEAEVFGARKGAFTGATADRMGLLQAADRGTLHLDELGELPQAMQPKLLRAVEQGEFIPLGSSQPVRVDLRVVSATNGDIEREVAEGLFRRDLYHRLRGSFLEMPPLRDRLGDIVVLALHHLTTSPVGEGTRFHPGTLFLERILLNPWPGNVRELFRTLDEAMVEARLAETDKLAPEHLPPTASLAHDSAFEPVRRALTESGGNVNDAAAVLRVSRGQIYRMLKEMGIKASSFR